MDLKRKKLIIQRMSIIGVILLSVLPVALFIALTINTAPTDIMGVSRWWNILVGPVWVGGLFWLFFFMKKATISEIIIPIVFGIGLAILVQQVQALNSLTDPIARSLLRTRRGLPVFGRIEHSHIAICISYAGLLGSMVALAVGFTPLKKYVAPTRVFRFVAAYLLSMACCLLIFNGLSYTVAGIVGIAGILVLSMMVLTVAFCVVFAGGMVYLGVKKFYNWAMAKE